MNAGQMTDEYWNDPYEGGNAAPADPYYDPYVQVADGFVQAAPALNDDDIVCVPTSEVMATCPELLPKPKPVPTDCPVFYGGAMYTGRLPIGGDWPYGVVRRRKQVAIAARRGGLYRGRHVTTRGLQRSALRDFDFKSRKLVGAFATRTKPTVVSIKLKRGWGGAIAGISNNRSRLTRAAQVASDTVHSAVSWDVPHGVPARARRASEAGQWNAKGASSSVLTDMFTQAGGGRIVYTKTQAGFALRPRERMRNGTAALNTSPRSNVTIEKRIKYTSPETFTYGITVTFPAAARMATTYTNIVNAVSPTSYTRVTALTRANRWVRVGVSAKNRKLPVSGYKALAISNASGSVAIGMALQDFPKVTTGFWFTPVTAYTVRRTARGVVWGATQQLGRRPGRGLLPPPAQRLPGGKYSYRTNWAVGTLGRVQSKLLAAARVWGLTAMSNFVDKKQVPARVRRPVVIQPGVWLISGVPVRGANGQWIIQGRPIRAAPGYRALPGQWIIQNNQVFIVTADGRLRRAPGRWVIQGRPVAGSQPGVWILVPAPVDPKKKPPKKCGPGFKWNGRKCVKVAGAPAPGARKRLSCTITPLKECADCKITDTRAKCKKCIKCKPLAPTPVATAQSCRVKIIQRCKGCKLNDKRKACAGCTVCKWDTGKVQTSATTTDVQLKCRVRKSAACAGCGVNSKAAKCTGCRICQNVTTTNRCTVKKDAACKGCGTDRAKTYFRDGKKLNCGKCVVCKKTTATKPTSKPKVTPQNCRVKQNARCKAGKCGLYSKAARCNGCVVCTTTKPAVATTPKATPKTSCRVKQNARCKAGKCGLNSKAARCKGCVVCTTAKPAVATTPKVDPKNCRVKQNERCKAGKCGLYSKAERCKGCVVCAPGPVAANALA
jgi:hypothetical protein